MLIKAWGFLTTRKRLTFILPQQSVLCKEGTMSVLLLLFTHLKIHEIKKNCFLTTKVTTLLI